MEPQWDWHCADHAVQHIKETTGRDIWKELGGSPKSTKRAIAIYRKLKARTLKTATSKVLGKPKKTAFAMRGDIVMVNNALGICRGEWVECLDAMHFIGKCDCAWSVKRG